MLVRKGGEFRMVPHMLSLTVLDRPLIELIQLICKAL